MYYYGLNEYMKKIALIIDVPNWAFDIEAKLLKHKLKEFYQVDIFAVVDYDKDLFSILEAVREYDIIHFFLRKLLIKLESEEFKAKIVAAGYNYDEYINDVCPRISTGIYDHLFIEEADEYIDVFTKYCKQYYTCSKRLEKIYNDLENYPKPWGTIHDTYDNKLYKNYKNKKFNMSDEFVIGWVGNSKWYIEQKDFKGFCTILEPVLDELIAEGYLIRKHYADRNIIFRTQEEMPEYYNELDVCVVVSMCEGTPRPIIEAMACGVPIITTDVGLVQESLGPKQKQYIIGSRENGKNDEEIKKKLKEKIMDLYNNREKLKELSKENYEYCMHDDIEHTYMQYKQYFDDFLKRG